MKKAKVIRSPLRVTKFSTWELKFAILPRLCKISKTKIWFQWYYGRTIIIHTFYVPPHKYKEAHTVIDHIIYRLKNDE